MKTLVLGLLLCPLFWAGTVNAQVDGMRVYWPLPKNMNVLGMHAVSGTVNATLTNLHNIQPSIDIQNQLYMLTYTRSQPIFGRSFMVTLALPAGVIQTDSSLPLPASDRFAHGIGDPSISATVNLFGAPGLMLREYVRYDLHTIAWVSVNATFPWGQYNSGESLNVGSNQTRLRVALPLVQAIGPWVPGNRTTLEVTPSVTLISDNEESQGQTLEQDPLWAAESHLTRDITRTSAISLDYTFLQFGESTRTDNATGAVTGTTESRNAHLLGITLDLNINDNLTLFVTHMQTLQEDQVPISLEGALFKATLTWSFHRVIERRRAFMQ